MSEKLISEMSNKMLYGNKRNRLSMRNILTSVILVLLAGMLFTQIGPAWEKALDGMQQAQKEQAEQVLPKLVIHANEELVEINKVIDVTLQEQDYFKDFDKKYWQEIFKTELSARLGKNVETLVFPVEYISDDIIDNPDHGYSILSLLNDIKQKGIVDAEIHYDAANQERIMMARQVKEFKKDEEDTLLGFILISIDSDLLDKIVTHLKPEQGYIEITQRSAGRVQIILAKGDPSLKISGLSLSRKISGSRWVYNFWPVAQNTETSLLMFWQPVVYAILGILSLVSGIVLLYRTIKKYRDTLYVAIPERQNGAFSKNKDNNNRTGSEKEVDDGLGLKGENNDCLPEVLNSIFRVDGIRGIVGEQISTQVFKRLAAGIATDALDKQQDIIAVACDGRNSSSDLVEALIEELKQSGINVLDIGMVPIPFLYYAALSKCNGNGVMVTASHEPANYNGLEIMLAGSTYGAEELDGLKDKILSDKKTEQAQGIVKKLNIVEEYITKITANIILARSMNIVIDSGNGVTGIIAQTLFEQLGCKVVSLFTEIDGDFPNHPPDPGRPENLTALSNAVIEHRADIGIAFDGNGERLGIIASGGDIIWTDRILMLLAKDILSRDKDATVLYDVKSTKNLSRFISKQGGKSFMCSCEHSLMKKKLLETGALLAGEMDGHIVIKDRWFGFDDALFAAARILEILSIDLRKSRQVFAELPDSLNTPVILVPVNDPHTIMDKLLADTSAFNDANIITIDGLRAEFSNGWGLVKASSTTENLSMRFEADDEQMLQGIALRFKDAVLEVEPETKFPF